MAGYTQNVIAFRSFGKFEPSMAIAHGSAARSAHLRNVTIIHVVNLTRRQNSAQNLFQRDTEAAKATMGERLTEFGPGIWIGEGPVVPFFGFPYPTRMALIRMEDGGLFVWSPIALSSGLKQEVDALGIVRHLVSPNKLHHLFLAEWKRAYPDALLYSSPGLRQRKKDLRFDRELGDTADPAWAAEIDQVLLRGSFVMTEAVFFHRASRTAIFADLIENFPHDWFKGWRGLLARLDGIVAPKCGAPREWRASFLDRRAARASFDCILAWPIERVLMAHGEPVMTNGGAFVRLAFAWLIGRER
jgi:hypothetical protein